MKARDTYAEAILLCGQSRNNGAASRAYYALYQAILPHVEKHYVKPSKLLAKLRMSSDRNSDKHWPHEAVARVCVDFIGQDNAKVYETALALRIQADYRPEPVDPGKLVGIMNRVPSILLRLGV